MTQIHEMMSYINEVRHRLGWDLIDTNQSMMGYLEDEVKELRIEIDLNHPQGIEDELMDVLFVCLSLIHDNRIELDNALKRKLEAVVQKYEAR
jgi:NTP pyrophosphatase (non-canonical NTP hydrolase)